MVDFAKLLNESPEEKQERRERMERESMERFLKENAESSVLREDFVLSQDPSIRFDRAGFPYAVLRSDNPKFDSAILRQIEGEEDRTFIKRAESLKAGDRVIADGGMTERGWKDINGKWHSRQEFEIGIPVFPPSIKPVLPEGVSMPTSAFEKRQQDAQILANLERQKASGMGM